MKRIAMVIALLALGTGVAALERSSADGPQTAPVDARPAALRPTYLFNMRGRRDPFLVSAGLGPAAGSFSISGLGFKGVIVVDGQATALFVAFADRSLYTLRGNRLYGSNDKALPGVSGRFLNEKEVRLKQGDLSINFSALRAPKR